MLDDFILYLFILHFTVAAWDARKTNEIFDLPHKNGSTHLDVLSKVLEENYSPSSAVKSKHSLENKEDGNNVCCPSPIVMPSFMTNKMFDKIIRKILAHKKNYSCCFI